MVKYLHEEVGVRVLLNIEDFLIAASFWRVSTAAHCERVIRVFSDILRELGLELHEGKGIWGRGSTSMDHLRVKWNTGAMEFTATR